MAVSRRLKIIIKEEAGFKCSIPNCNVTSPLEIHHINHQANGGDDSKSNLICLCRNCHGRVHNNEIPDESIQRYKTRIERLSADVFPHHTRYLEALLRDEEIILDSVTIDDVRRLERQGYINITEITNNSFQLSLTTEGRNLIS